MSKIKNWFLRGDTHGEFLWMTDGCLESYKPEETAIVILGDCGLDFYLNKTDERKKKEVEARGYYIYWLRGNHEERAANINTYELIYDENIQGEVYCDKRFPHLRALKDFGFYKFGQYLCLVIGGAYSVDKAWRLSRVGLTEETNNPKKSGWFKDEQIHRWERDEYMDTLNYWVGVAKVNEVDFILSHTCPRKYQPTDLFLNFIDQSTVDTSMEDWMDKITSKIKWKYAWCFGHYHHDRIEAPYIEQYYKDIETFDNIAKRWERYHKTGELDWYLVKSPNFYGQT